MMLGLCHAAVGLLGQPNERPAASYATWPAPSVRGGEVALCMGKIPLIWDWGLVCTRGASILLL